MGWKFFWRSFLYYFNRLDDFMGIKANHQTKLFCLNLYRLRIWTTLVVRALAVCVPGELASRPGPRTPEPRRTPGPERTTKRARQRDLSTLHQRVHVRKTWKVSPHRRTKTCKRCARGRCGHKNVLLLIWSKKKKKKNGHKKQWRRKK